MRRVPGFKRGVKTILSRAGRDRRRVAAVAALLSAGALSAGPAAGGGVAAADSEPAARERAGGQVLQPRNPVASTAGALPAARARPSAQGAGSRSAPLGKGVDLRLRGRRLLAGRSGQRLIVRVKVGARWGGPESDDGAGTKALQVVLRRIARPDPRHPDQAIGGELVARRQSRLEGGRARLRLGGLAPEPGPHRVAVRLDGRRIAAARVEVAPQELRPAAVRTPEASPAAGARPAGLEDASPRRRAGGSSGYSLLAEGVDHDLSFGPGSQASSAVAVNAAAPERVIAASDDFGERPVAYVSDAGLAVGSVTSARLPQQVAIPGAGSPSTKLETCCDPAVAAGPDGSLWMAAAAADGSRIVVGRIAPGDSGFGPTATGLPTAGGGDSQTKPALALLDGQWLAAAWIETLGGVQNVVLSRCSLAAGAAACDAPGAWSAPVPLTAGGGLYSMPTLAFSPGGDLHAGWWNAGAANAIEIDSCRAGEPCEQAATWDEGAVVANLDAADDDGDGDADPMPLFCPIIAAPGGLVNPSPSIAVDGDGYVYVSYSNLRQNADPSRPSRCTASGSDKTFDALLAAGAAPGTPPAPDSAARLSSDGATALNDHFLAAIAADPASGLLEASFYSTELDPGGQRAARVYVASGDRGVSFTVPFPISDAASRFAGPRSDGIDYGDRQGADAAGGVFRPVWTDNRPQQSRDPDLYTLSSAVDTTIDSGPSGGVTVPAAVSSFSFSTAAPRTECRVDGGRVFTCTSPLAVGPVPNGGHRLEIQPTDAAGNPQDRSPAVAEWAVQDVTPPETVITRSPRRRTKRKRPRFEFEANELGARFQCRYDGGPWTACRTPKRGKVGIGRHAFGVRALDIARNIDPTPAKASFRRLPKRGDGR